MSWNIKTPGDYINGPLTVAGSAAITGDLTVDTNVLKVDTTNDRVGIGTTNTFKPLTVQAGSTGAATINQGLVINSSAAFGVGQGVSYSSLVFSRNRSIDTSSLTASAEIFGGNSAETSSLGGFLGFRTQNAAGTLTDRYTIDNTGISTWSVAGTTAMTLNSTGLGIGTTILGGQKLAIGSSSDTSATTNGFNIVTSRATFATTCNGAVDAAGTTINYSWANGGQGPLIFRNAAISNVLTLDSAGNVGIGVTPSAWATYKAVSVGGIGASVFGLGSSQAGVAQGAFFNNGAGSGWAYSATSQVPTYYLQINGENIWNIAPSGTAGAQITAWTSAMKLDASGNLLVGVTSALASGSTFQNLGTARQVLTLKGNDATSYTLGIWSATTTGDNFFAYFGTEAGTTVRGSVTYNRAGGLVLYNTTSDYRAKDIIGSVLNSGSLIDSLKVYVGKMKGATIERPMLIAHEVQEIAPYAVNGEKDSVDADGKPKYQQMDASALVPLLIAEIQSLRTRVQTLEAR